VPQQWAWHSLIYAPWKRNGNCTKVNPYSTRCQNVVDDAQIVDNIFRLTKIWECEQKYKKDSNRANEETCHDRVPLAVLRLTLISIVWTINFFKVACVSPFSVEKLVFYYNWPAIRENSEPGGRSEGNTSGIFTGRSKAALDGMLEKECT
jgi:hypothetical protein